jgi:hypothetical protein
MVVAEVVLAQLPVGVLTFQAWVVLVEAARSASFGPVTLAYSLQQT